MRTLGIILLSLFVLLGCGRKGALFLPPHAPEQKVTEQKVTEQQATPQQAVSTQSEKNE